MAEADGIGAAGAGRDDQAGDLVETLRTSCDALATTNHQRSELYATAPLQKAEASTRQSADEYVTARRRRLEQLRSECGSEAEFEMAKSQEHWTVVGGASSDMDLVLVANRQHFQRLLERDALSASDYSFYSNSIWETHGVYKGYFFKEYGDGELVMGEKIGEGGQAEIFKAILHGKDEFVLKVFKPDFSLVDLERHWTVRTRDGFYFKEDARLNCCFIKSGTLLKDGRFAFVMERYWGDLRKLIDQNMMANNGLGPPFPSIQAMDIMFEIVLGMGDLHNHNILHRDLKASNVLIRRSELAADRHYHQCVVADFESSRGAQGTRFWRAPEVLQALKDKVKDPNVWTNIWSEKVDVYGYAMTSYEVLTGRIPFGDLVGYEYDVVLRGERPLLLDYVDPRIQELLGQCWHSDPLKRPNFLEIYFKLKKIRQLEPWVNRHSL